MEDGEDCKNKKSFQGKCQKKLQFGDKMEEVREENEGQISELAYGVLGVVTAAPDLTAGLGEIFPNVIKECGLCLQ